ncbi:hypothetical protein [Isachenkonia alkalipeptolytica]|uniref:hypothetical protein n=1 Tax=Isachenkonia alkalipeptolytica TaxID=2565777 RepID=UPI00136F8D1A|nr:hypothetical protein [Isachenkonia alkalipeptolytica]
MKQEKTKGTRKTKRTREKKETRETMAGNRCSPPCKGKKNPERIRQIIPGG